MLVVAVLAVVAVGGLGSAGGDGDYVPALAEASVSPDGRLIAFTA